MRTVAAVLLIIAMSGVIVRSQPQSYQPNTVYSVIVSDGPSFSIVAGECDTVSGAAACASIDDGIWTSGWYTLNVRTTDSSAVSDSAKALGSGYLEGVLTAPMMWDAWTNFVNGTATTYSFASPAVEAFAAAQDNWVQNSVKQNTGDVYWTHVGLVWDQWYGLFTGYNAAMADQTDKQLPYLSFLAYQLQSELGDIASAVGVSNPANILNPTMNHCSSLVKITARGELFAAQDTWSTFNTMIRIWKNWQHNYQSVPTVTGMSFSSYPGTMPSVDDYYTTSANLVVMETTNGVMNQSLYEEFTTTETVPYWMRIIVANRMARDGSAWMSAFGRYNSGTYNNQWIIVDPKKYTPNAPLKAGLLWIGEQIPGYLVSEDMTSTLEETSYWASYNIPFFPFVYNISGFWPFYEKYGNTYSHDHCARANIFRRDEGGVEDIDDMKHIMRYNEWQTDALSEKDSCRGISARCDLNPPWAGNTLNSYSAFGAIDSKITTNTLSASMTTLAVAGPTWDSQPPFAWTQQWASVPHAGMPDVFNFEWVTQTPQFP